MISLRAYQKQGINETYSSFREGYKKILYVAATGSGKSVSFSYLISEAYRFNMNAVLVVKRRSLIFQASKHLHNWGIPHGIYMSDHPNYNPGEKIQICSIDTLSSRDTYPHTGENTLLIIDECFSKDTEILTENGFIRFEELKDEKVAQVNKDTRKVTFVTPTRKIKKMPTSKMVRVKTDKSFDIHVTENHEMLVYKNNEGWIKEKVKNVTTNRRILTAAYGGGREYYLKPFEKLAIAYQADGSMGYDRVGASCILHFQFSKRRKINKFLKLMREGGFNWKELKSSPKKGNAVGKKRYHVDIPYKMSKDISSYFNLKKLSLRKAREIIEYMNHWDGSVASKNCYIYTNTDKKAVDFYQAVCCLAGCGSKITKVIDNRKDTFKDVYRLFIVKRNTVSTQPFKPVESDYNDYVYCVTVPEGNIITRLGGKTIVSGNCHDCGSRTYQTLLDHYKESYLVGFTATPYADNSMFEKYICPIEPWDLMKQGYLVPDRTFVPSTIDTSKVKIRAGEFVNKDLEEACSDSFVVGDIVKSWKTYANNLRTVLFAVNIAHSKLMCKTFNDCGIPAVHCDATTSQEVREEAISKLVSREIKVLCNVNIFSTGVDIPEIECIDFCRPTQSLIYWIQAVGRGLRPSPEKENCMILDHAGNTYRHGGVYLPRQILLEKIGSGKISEENDIEMRTCDECFYIYQGKFCPVCGFENKNKNHVIKVKDGELKEYTISEDDIHRQRVSNFYAEYHKLKVVASRKGFKPNWVYYQLLKRYDKNFCAKYGKRIDFPNFLLN